MNGLEISPVLLSSTLERYFIVDLSCGSITASGSITSSSNYDYYLSNSGTSNNFTNTNFTAARTVYLSDTTSWFNYRKDYSSNIWLKTNVSVASTNIIRKLVNWGQNLIQWNDTTSKTITARYSITGLSTDTLYNVYNNSVLTYSLNSGPNGIVNFTIKLPINEEHNITVEATSTSPLYFNNYVNNTIAGKPTKFSLNWTDDVGLSGYIFSFDNGTGTFNNDTWIRFPAGTDNSNYLGNTSIQSQTGYYMESNTKWGWQVTAKDSGNVTSITWYLQKDISGTSNVLLGLYDDTGSNAPNNLLGSCSVVATTTYQWLSCNLNGITIIKNSKYWLAFLPETGDVNFRHGSDSNGRGYEQADTYSDGMSNSWGTPGTFDNTNPDSAYINYTLINASWSNATKTINSNVGSTIRWCVYANDTDNNWNSASCSNPFVFTTT